MKIRFFFASTILMFCCMTLKAQYVKYPTAKRIHSQNTYHGVSIMDPYSWMEDVDSEEVQSWMKEQDQVLHQFVRDGEEWNAIYHRIKELGETGSGFSIPFEVAGGMYYQEYPVGSSHSSLFYRETRSSEDRLVIDFEKEFSTHISMGNLSYSPDGKYAAFSFREGQVRWGKLMIIDLITGEIHDPEIQGIRSSLALWEPGSSGFYYETYGDTEGLNEGARPHAEIRYRRWDPSRNASEMDDQLIYKNVDDPNVLFAIYLSHGGEFLVVETYAGTSDRNGILIYSNETHQVSVIHPPADYLLTYIGSKGNDIYCYTNRDAPNGKVVKMNISDPAHKVEEVIGENDQILAGGSSAGGNAMNLIGDNLVLLYRYATHQYLKIFSLRGELQVEKELETGWIGSGLRGRPNGKYAWYSLNTFVDPSNVYQLDLTNGKSKAFFERDLPIDRADYVTRNTYYYSEDGTKVPIYIAHKKGLDFDGSNPVFMYAYGFAGWVAVPWYQPHMLSWLEMGGIYVLPGVRGGGEFGDEWKEAGMRHNRQNAIADFISAGEFLIKEGYTSAGKIVANGWSASGSLAAASVMQRPDLFGAGMIGIPSLDLLKYEQFTQFKGWTSGYGTPSDSEDFHHLLGWSPYHNIKEGICYPPMMITVGEIDATTPPQHGYKFTAAMQRHQQSCEKPVLLKIVWNGGHGFGTNSQQTRETQTDELVFLAKVLDLEFSIRHSTRD